MILSDIQRKHNMCLELYIRAETEAASQHYQRLAYKYYAILGTLMNAKPHV